MAAARAGLCGRGRRRLAASCSRASRAIDSRRDCCSTATSSSATANCSSELRGDQRWQRRARDRHRAVASHGRRRHGAPVGRRRLREQAVPRARTARARAHALRASGQLRDARSRAARHRGRARARARRRGEQPPARRHPPRGDRRALGDRDLRILARRVARALEISHCSVVLARAGDRSAPSPRRRRIRRIQDVEIQLDAIRRSRAALESDAPGARGRRDDPSAVRRDARRAGRARDEASPCGRSRRSRSRSTAGVRACSSCAPIAASAALTTDDVEFADVVDSRGGGGDPARAGAGDDARRQSPARGARDDRSADARAQPARAARPPRRPRSIARGGTTRR